MNPEFRRNLWLEFTPHRLVSMPLVLAGIFYLAFLLDQSQFGLLDARAAETIAAILCVVWGASLAADAVISEVRGGTWENQRMSALTPWQLAWGKLFGGTIFAWYGTAICLLVYFLSIGTAAVAAAKIVAILVMAGILSQGASLLSVLYALRKDRGLPRMRAGLYALAGLFFIYPLIPMAATKPFTLHWYGMEWTNIDFALFSLAIFAGWTLVGVFRAMRAELQLRSTFWIWAAFVVWLMVYAAGFADFLFWGRAESRINIACFVGFALFYLMVFIESKDPVHFSRLLLAVRSRNGAALQTLLPNWSTALLLTAVAIALLFVTEPHDKQISGSLFFLSALFFALRDLCIILALNFGKRRNRADVAAIVYLAVLYGLLPRIVAELSSEYSLAFFYPRPVADGDAILAMVAALAEAAFAFWLMRRRWRENYAVAQLQPEKE